MAKRDREAVNRGLSDIFGSAAAPDLISSVVHSDRRRTGRTLPSEPSPSASRPVVLERVEDEVMTSHNVIKQYDNMTDKQSDNKTNVQYDNRTSNKTIGQTDKHSDDGPEPPERGVRKRAARRPDSQGVLEKRVHDASKMAKSPTITVTLRIPQELNTWLDEYVHRAWPDKVRKQELVIEALKMLYARRGRPGEEVVETELLPKTDND
jgi:hypothetical protein